MLRATGHTLKVSSCASVDGRGELRRAAEPTPNGINSMRAESTYGSGSDKVPGSLVFRA